MREWRLSSWCATKGVLNAHTDVQQSPVQWVTLSMSTLIFLPAGGSSSRPCADLYQYPLRSVWTAVCLLQVQPLSNHSPQSSFWKSSLKSLHHFYFPFWHTKFILICVIYFRRVLFIHVAVCTRSPVMTLICFCQSEKSILLPGTSKKNTSKSNSAEGTWLVDGSRLRSGARCAVPSLLDDFSRLVTYSCAKKQSAQGGRRRWFKDRCLSFWQE